jgi:hypothetical protein
MTVENLLSMLASWQLRFSTEATLQSDIEIVLSSEGVEHHREVQLSKKDIIDFVVGRVGIECKIDGPRTAVLSQLSRYAQHDSVDELLLVTSRASHRLLHGLTLNEKSIHVLWIGGL